MVAAPPRQTTLWTCAVCKRTFEEALHPKEALDTDQHYYACKGMVPKYFIE